MTTGTSAIGQTAEHNENKTMNRPIRLAAPRLPLHAALLVPLAFVLLRCGEDSATVPLPQGPDAVGDAGVSSPDTPAATDPDPTTEAGGEGDAGAVDGDTADAGPSDAGPSDTGPLPPRPDADADTEVDGSADAAPRDTAPDDPSGPPTDTGHDAGPPDDAGEEVSQDADIDRDGGSDPGDRDTGEGDALPTTPVALAVEVDEAPLEAGAFREARCLALDREGAVLDEAPSAILEAGPAGILFRTGSRVVQGRRMGQGEVRCVDPVGALAPSTGRTLVVVPGPVATYRTVVVPAVVQASEPATVQCEAVDAWGNRTPVSPPGFDIAPAPGAGDDASEPPDRVVVRRAGVWQVRCTGLEPVASEARMVVRPGPPVRLRMRLLPFGRGIQVGAPLTPQALLTDAWGNAIDDPEVWDRVVWTSEPSGSWDGTSFRFDREMLTTVQGTLTLDDGTVLKAEELVRVFGIPPVVTCEWPADGSFIEVVPGTRITLRGTARDEVSLRSLTANGVPIPVQQDGSWAWEWTVQPGVNFVQYIAREDGPDTVDRQLTYGVRVCSFMAAPRYRSWDSRIDDAVFLQLGARALDAGPGATGPPSSLAQLLTLALSDPSLAAGLDAALAENPEVFAGCVIPNPFGGCLTSGSVRYEGNLRIGGPNVARLQPVAGSLRTTLALRSVSMDLSVRNGSGGLISILSLSMDQLSAITDLVPTLGATGLTLEVSGGVDTTITGLRGTFSGASALLLNPLFSLLAPILTTELERSVEGTLRDTLPAIVGGVFSGLDLVNLELLTDVPSANGTQLYETRLALAAQEVGVTPDGMTLRLQSRWEVLSPAPEAPANPVLPSLTVSPVPAATPDLTFGLSLDAINQGLHVLWLAGYFDISLGRVSLPELTGDLEDAIAELTFTATLPPMFSEREGVLFLSFGGLTTDFVTRLFGARDGRDYRASVGVHLRGNIRSDALGNLVVENFELAELRASVDNFDLDPVDLGQLEGALISQIAGLTDFEALNALQGLVIPAIEGTEATAAIGLGPGQAFGLTNPVFALAAQRLLFRGPAGIQ
jgi:hypothetical protein